MFVSFMDETVRYHMIMMINITLKIIINPIILLLQRGGCQLFLNDIIFTSIKIVRLHLFQQ